MNKLLVTVMAVTLSFGTVFASGGKDGAAAASGGKVPLSVWSVMAAEIPLTPDTVEAWNVIENKTGTDLSWKFVSTLSEVKDQQFNLMMAAGDLPDIIAYYEKSGGHTAIEKLGSEGAFIPLEDLIAKYAPNLKKVILDDPVVRASVTAPDGHIYYVPMLSALNAERGWFIRTDWLEKLGLKEPKTTEDLYNVLVAFRDGDPNGNGLKDEIPMVARRRGDDWMYNLGALAYAFDADVEWVVRKGKVSYGPSEPQYKEYLAYIARLYKEKLLDQEILTRKGNPRDELLSKNITGSLHDWFASTADLNKLSATIPGFALKHFAPPLGTVKKPFTRIQMSKVRADGGWSITAKNKNTVETIKMMDFVYSTEGIKLTNFGIEGKTYNMVDGVPVYTAEITKNPAGLGMHEALVTNGAQWKIGMIQSIDYEKQFANAQATAARLDYMKNYIVEKFPTLSFTPAETEIIKEKYSQIQLLTTEMAARVMVGAMSVSDFDKAVLDMKKVGLDEVVKIYQTAYDRRSAKK